jgi:hypothetical protein
MQSFNAIFVCHEQFYKIDFRANCVSYKFATVFCQERFQNSYLTKSSIYPKDSHLCLSGKLLKSIYIANIQPINGHFCLLGTL